MASATNARRQAGPDGGAPRRFRAHLLGLVLAVALPLVALAAALVLWTAEGRRDEALRDLQQGARALQVALDRELGLTVAALQALGASPLVEEALAQGSGGEAAARFHDQARRLIAERRHSLSTIWLVPLNDPVPVVNTLVPPGQAAPAITTARFPPRPIGAPPTAAEIRAVLARGEIYVSDLLRGPLADWTIVVALPLRRDGAVQAIIGAGISPASLGHVLRGDGVPPGTTAALIDRGGLVVARGTEEARLDRKSVV